MAKSAACPQNILSVDVEEHFHVEAFSKVINRRQWDQYPSRVEANTHKLLDLFDKKDVKATFFFLGWVAKRHPRLVKEVANRGHEIACHSFWHRLVYTLGVEEFRKDTREAKDCIEQALGQRVCGYRAPSFSIVKSSLWAMDVLAELGFRYDSSVFPVRHDLYGFRDAPRQPFAVRTNSGRLMEFPLATFRVGGSANFAVGGGGYLRLMPSWYTAFGMSQARRQGVTVVTYIHPWEVDPEQPHIAAPFRSRFRHYTNLATTENKLLRMLSSGKFLPFRESIALEIPTLGIQPSLDATPQPVGPHAEFEFSGRLG